MLQNKSKTIAVESAFNEYVKLFGGELVSELIPKSPDFDNADYLFLNRSIVAELKCLEKDLFKDEAYQRKFISLYVKWMKDGIVPKKIPKQIQTKDLPIKCQLEVVNLMKRPIERTIKKANNQIKETKEHFQVPNAKGLLLLVNDGNYSLESDTVMNLVTRITKSQYSSINNIIYFTVNMPAHHPNINRDLQVWLDARHSREEELPKDFRESLRDGWIKYLENRCKNEIPQIVGDESVLEKMTFIKDSNT